jgi:NOL1/NOP2/sun family putative RNA methylase
VREGGEDTPHGDAGAGFPPASFARLERYRDIVPDWEAFRETVHTPEPVTLRARQALTDEGELTRLLRNREFQVEAIGGMPGYLRVRKGPDSVAQTLEHWLGLFHIQQVVMGLPSLALAPEPGQRVLDLCAAPGGKTTHLSELMGERGPLVAVDRKEKRLRGLMGNLFRLGCTNVLVLAADGRELPSGALFDRVLVDVPCSAEGNYRRQGGRLPDREPEFQHYVTSLQEALLRRAVQLTRPGGVIVYSTCTFAPEENEAVVQRVLADSPDLEVEPVTLPVPHAPGLEGWQGTEFVPALKEAWRVYPHHLDSGGLFMVRLRNGRADEGEVDERRPSPCGPQTRGAPADPGDGGVADFGGGVPGTRAGAGWETIPPAFPGGEEDPARARIETAVGLLRDEYGFTPELLETLGWMVRKENIWVQTAHEWPVGTWRPHGGWRVVSLGLRAFRSAGPGLETPSNHFLGRFRDALWTGKPRSRTPMRRRELTRTELTRLLAGDALADPDLPAGPIVLYYEGVLLGRGMVGRSGLRSEIPAHQAERLQAVLSATSQ